MGDDAARTELRGAHSRVAWDLQGADHVLGELGRRRAHRVLGELDVIGVNAFYPLAEKDGAPFDVLLEGGKRVQARVRALGGILLAWGGVSFVLAMRWFRWAS